MVYLTDSLKQPIPSLSFCHRPQFIIIDSKVVLVPFLHIPLSYEHRPKQGMEYMPAHMDNNLANTLKKLIFEYNRPKTWKILNYGQ